MTEILSILLLTCLQFIAGLGVINLFGLRLRPAMLLSLSLLTGIAVFSFVPFVLQLCYLPLSKGVIIAALLITAALLNIRYKRSLRMVGLAVKQARFSIVPYETPFLIIIAVIVFASAWRCFYFPPTPRDLTSGAEVIAEYAVREKTMLNSVFTVNLETTNNQFKPPFIASLQIIYKYAGFPFGQIWLSTVVIAFLIFLYHLLCQRIHRLLAGFLLVAFLAIPEMYAYTFMVLFDYSNAVFFLLSCHFLFEYFKIRKPNELAFAALLMGIATYIRSETLILAFILALSIAVNFIQQRRKFIPLLKAGIVFLIPSVISYILSITVYVNMYLPARYDVEGLVNRNLFNLYPFWERLVLMNKRLLFGKMGTDYYGYFFYLFLVILLFDLIVNFRLNRDSRNWLFASLVIYLGMPFLGYLLPLLDIDHSTKRGLFKLFPLLLLFMGSSTLLKTLSQKITNWETRKGTA